MKIIHTSDWHLGRSLYGVSRHEEFEQFLNWMVETLAKQAADALLIAGDVFDSSTPSHATQALYYHFLSRASMICPVVVIAGNHDSPSLLNAPKPLLNSLNVHVVGGANEHYEEVIVLKNAEQTPIAIICAVPFLRDRDVRLAKDGEGLEEKSEALSKGIFQYYQRVIDYAEQLRLQISSTIPLIAMGHLFLSGGRIVEGDGVRELYVGGLSHLHASEFPAVDYFALGHLHAPQHVDQRPTIRYSGSPIAMGFSDASQQKSLTLIEFEGVSPTVSLLPVPVFQKLARIQGDFVQIEQEINQLKQLNERVYLEIIYDGKEVLANLRERIEYLTQGSHVIPLKIKVLRLTNAVLRQDDALQNLEALSPLEVFERCLMLHEIPESSRQALIQTYQEVLHDLAENDLNEK